MNDPVLRADKSDVVLAGLKATPSGWPTASLDPGRGRRLCITCGGPNDNGNNKIASLRFQGIADIAEIELSALTRQCLDRRINDLDVLNHELAAWQHSVNADQRQVNWHITTTDTRTRLRHLYPDY